MKSRPKFDDLVDCLISIIGSLPEPRAGNNMKYTMEDIALSAFSVFFTQSPSFLAFQKSMREQKRKDNAESFFKVEKIPTDNHIREHLDKIDPRLFFPVFDTVFNTLKQNGILDSYCSFNNNLLHHKTDITNKIVKMQRPNAGSPKMALGMVLWE